MDQTLHVVLFVVVGIIAGSFLIYKLAETTDAQHLPWLEGLLTALITALLITGVSHVLGLDWRVHARVLRDIVFVAWIIHVINWAVFRGRLSEVCGIRPRQWRGLLGIVCAPFLHAWQPGHDLQADHAKNHVFGNTWAFIVLGWLILLQIDVENFFSITLVIALIAGLCTWLWGRPGPHAGASSITYGYTGFLLAYGVFAGNIAAYLFAVLVAIAYGQQISSLLPGRTPAGTSWEGHLFGFLAGLLAAVLLVAQPEFMQNLVLEQIPNFIWPDSMYVQ